MHLKDDVNFSQFMQAVMACKGDVWFCTNEDDRLNLKSMLTRYIFAALVSNKPLLLESTVVLNNAEDAETLAPFLA